NGILSYTAQIDEWWASVLLVEARLDVSTRQVPDSASVVALLGASLVGMSLLRRKRRSQIPFSLRKPPTIGRLFCAYRSGTNDIRAGDMKDFCVRARRLQPDGS